MDVEFVKQKIRCKITKSRDCVHKQKPPGESPGGSVEWQHLQLVLHRTLHGVGTIADDTSCGADIPAGSADGVAAAQSEKKERD
jgi:hypothetical protein